MCCFWDRCLKRTPILEPLIKVFYMQVDGAPVMLFSLKHFVNYHLVVSYPQQRYIGININHWYIIIIAIYIMLLFAFSHAELSCNNFYKLLFIIFICEEKQTHWPYKQYYVKTARYFYQKFKHLFLNAGKTGNVQEFEFERF